MAGQGAGFRALPFAAGSLAFGTWSVTNKLLLAFGLLIAIFGVGGVIAGWHIRLIENELDWVVEVGTPLEGAVLGMGISAGEINRAAHDYARDLDPEHLQALRASEADFERFAADFDAHADTGDGRRLGRQITDLFSDFAAVAHEITALAERRREFLGRFGNVAREIDGLLDAEIASSPDVNSPDGETTRNALNAMDGLVDEAFPSVEAYTVRPDPALRQEFLEAVSGIKELGGLYRRLTASAGASLRIDRLDEAFEAAVSAGNGAMVATDSLLARLDDLGRRLKLINAVLYERILPLIHERTVAAAADTKSSADRSVILILILGVAAVALGAFAANTLSRGIIRPVRALVRGAEIAGNGTRTHRIEVTGANEFGHLAASFNRMVENLARSGSLLRDSEERLRAILETAADGIITIDERGTVESFNKAAQVMFGYAADEVVGKNVSMLMPEPYCDQHVHYLRRFQGSGETRIIGVNREVEGRRKDGSTFPMEIAVGEARSRGRRLFTGVVREITRRKQADAAHRERERQTNLLMNSVPALISYVDREQRFRLNNKAYERMYGRSVGEITGRTVEEVLGTAAYRGAAPYIEGALGGKTIRFENVIHVPNGEPRTLEVSYVPDLDESGTVKGLFVLAIDITDRTRAAAALRQAHERLEERVQERTADLRDANATLEAEIAARRRAETALRDSNERFKDFAELASDWLWEMDENLRFSYFSEEFVPRTRIRLYDILGRTREDVIAPDEDPELWRAHLDTLRARRPILGFTYRYRHPDADGGELYIRINGKPLFDGDGVFTGYRGTGLDVTEEIETLRALRAASAEAEQANVTKSEFLANMSHELRTPLNAIVGFSEIMKNETFGPVGSVKYRDYANDINGAGQHLLELINDILDLSKIESGNEELSEENIEVSELIESVRSLVAGRAERDRVALEFKPVENLPTLRADRRKMKQVLVNLISNAIKFTEAGGRVTFESRLAADGGHVFRIVDTGIGMASEDIPKALTPFRQIEGPLARKHEGTGLGLPLTNSLVEMHGGSLRLQSELGVGTTVTVQLPPARAVVDGLATRKHVG